MLKYIHNWLCMMYGEQNFIFLWIRRWNPKSEQPKYTNSIPIQNTQNKTIPNQKA